MRAISFISRLFAVSGLLVVLTATAFAETATDSVLEESQIIFIGTVEKTRSSSVDSLAQRDDMIVVRVIDVAWIPEILSLKEGDEITIKVKDPKLFREGTQAIFYTKVWVLGNSIAVTEIGHEIWDEKSDRLVSEAAGNLAVTMAKYQDTKKERKLWKRLDEADIVISGRVLEVYDSTALKTLEAPPQTFISEHDPMMKEAVIEVETALKGAEAGQRIIARFPSSMDVMWYQSPKLSVGQEATFILTEDRISVSSKAYYREDMVMAYTILSPDDVMPKDAMENLKSLSEK